MSASVSSRKVAHSAIHHAGRILPGETVLNSRIARAASTVFIVLNEIRSVFYAAYFCIRYRSEKSYESGGINPTVLTETQAKQPAIVLLPGDWGKAAPLIPLARQIHAAAIGPVFLFDLTYNDENPNLHLKQLDGKLKSIKEKYEKLGKRFHVMIGGHSAGTRAAAMLAFNALENASKEKTDSEIVGVIAIAGRVRVLDPNTGPKACHPAIQGQIRAVDQGIQTHPDFPMYAIIPAQDRIVPRAATELPLLDNNVVIPGTNHLSVVYSCATAFINFVNKMTKQHNHKE